jgi:hypothetical protein
MKKSLILLVIGLAITPERAIGQTSLSFGQSVTCLSTTSAGAVTGASYAAPPGGSAYVTTWQLIHDGSAISVTLQGSLDGTSWSTLGTATANGLATVSSSATRFIRCIQTSRTGGTSTRILLSTGRTTQLGGMSGTLSGQLQLQNGTATAPALTFTSDNDTGLYTSAGNILDLTLSGTNYYRFTSTPTLWIKGDTANLTMGAATDTRLYRDAAETFAQRNGTNPQTFRIYNTYTDASNYERGFLRWASNIFEVGTASAGTGVSRALRLISSNSNVQLIDSAGTSFGLLQFGGTTSAFPALRRSGSNIDVRTADDLSFAAMSMHRVLLTGSVLASLPVASNGTVIYCSDCTNASNPCTGGGSGAIAKRLNGAWDCR